MNPKPIILAAALLTTVPAAPAQAGCEADLSRYVGWEIVYVGKVTGYIDDDGEEENTFQGCRYGRELILDYSKTVTCNEYRYAYAYRPDIVILSRSYRWEACIDDKMYRVRR